MRFNISQTIACLTAATVLSGCASMAPQQSDRQSPAVPKTSTTVPDSGIDQASTQPPWRPIPNPDDDLWIRVRNGYQLPAQYGHPGIKKWVRFYLEHDKHLSASLRRAQPYLWHIVEALNKRDLPLELALLPIVESGYDTGALSYAGAGGLWQFMPPTANDMGLRQGWWFDGRFDVMASTRAALDYLAWLHDYFDGNWLLAIAAYNGGPGRVEDALARARARGLPASFWHLDLPAQTTAYVPKLLALRRLLAEPKQYNLSWPYLTNMPKTTLVKLPAQIEVDIAADMLDMTERRLRTLNPGIKHSATAPGHADADLLVPISKAKSFRLALAQTDPDQLVTRNWYRVRRGDTLTGIAQAHSLSVAALRRANGISGSRIIVGQRLAIPRPGAPVEVPTQPYVVQPGDSLWQIAHRHGITVAALRRVNQLSSDLLSPGQTLELPTTAGPATHRVASGDTLWAIAQRYNVRIADLRRWNRLSDHAVLHPGQVLAVSGAAPLPDFYLVQDGDTLWAIAQHFGINVATLRNINDINNPNALQSGQRLRLQPAG